MTEGRVKKILLATDLGARSDRALDRAVMLAAEWRAELLVLHVLEEADALAGLGKPVPAWRRPPDPKSVAERRLEADLEGLEVRPVILVEKGDPGEVILRVAEAQGCDLVVTGLARDEPLGRFSPGATVDRLLRQSGILLLVVKERPRRPYLDVVVAADFSESARLAIETAAELFPEQPLTVLHGYDAPMAGLMEDPQSYRRNYADVAVAGYSKFMETVRLPVGHEAPNAMIESGEPGPLLDALA
ncbi:universal stress protein, partial [Rhizobiaceae sp. 2RAB30]